MSVYVNYDYYSKKDKKRIFETKMFKNVTINDTNDILKKILKTIGKDNILERFVIRKKKQDKEFKNYHVDIDILTYDELTLKDKMKLDKCLYIDPQIVLCLKHEKTDLLVRTFKKDIKKIKIIEI